MKADVEKLMDCYTRNKGVYTKECTDLYLTLFKNKSGRNYAGVALSADECKYDDFGCGATFDNPIMRATMTVKSWFDHWSSFGRRANSKFQGGVRDYI